MTRTRPTRRQLWNDVEDLAGDEPDMQLVVSVPERSRLEPTDDSEWWHSDDVDQSQYMVTVNGRERVPIPDFYPGRGIQIPFPSERAAVYAQYTDEHRRIERERRREDGDPVPPILDDA
jgi:hypothetical protein